MRKWIKHWVFVGMLLILVSEMLWASPPLLLASSTMAVAANACPTPQFSSTESRYVGWYGDTPANTPNPSYNGMPNLTATAIAGGAGVNVTFISEGWASIIRLANINSSSFAAAVSNQDYIYARVTINSGTTPVRLSSTDVNAVGTISGGAYFLSLVVIDLGPNQSTTVYQDRSIPSTGTNINQSGSYTMLPGQSYELRWYVHTGSLWLTTRSIDNLALNFQAATNCSNSNLNLAQGKSATQSSTFSDAVAARGVDGNTNGNYSASSVTHTNFDVNPWWQVDLGSTAIIDSITLWNRTDCCGDRLTNFFVFVANYDMTGKGFGDLVVDSTVWRYSLGTTAPTTLNIPANTAGRYVRVQLAGTNHLQLAEVQVFGTAAGGTGTGTTVTDGVYLVKALHSNKCMDVAGAGTVNGSNVQQWSCITGARQHQWQFTAVGNGYYKIINVNSGKALDVAGISAADGANIHQWEYIDGGNQKWKPVPQGDGSYQLVAAHSNKCADVSGGSTADGANIAQYGCHTGTNQRFTLTAVTADPPATTTLPEGIYLIKAVHSGKCMQVIEARLVSGVNTEQWRCEPRAKQQQWRFVALGNGYYKIVNVNSGKVLDVWGVSTADTMPLWQMDDLNRVNQMWKFVLQGDGSYQLVALHSNKCGTVTNSSLADGAGIAQYPCGTGTNQRFNLELQAETIVTNFEDNTLGMFTGGNGSTLTTDAESGQKAASAPAMGNAVAAHNTITPQTPLTVIAWVKGRGTAYISFARSNFTEINNTYRSINTTTWQQITFAATAPANTAYYDLVFRADNGAFLVDNIVVILNERDTDGDGLLDRVEACGNSGTLNYEFYDGAVAGNSLTNLPITGALAKGVTTDFDVQRLQAQLTPSDLHNYGLRYSGYLWVTEAGQYTFFTNSDDGSLLFIDQRLVVNNDGNHPVTERSGTVHLFAGLHRFELLYSAYSAPNSLAVQWSGPSFSKSTLAFNRFLSCEPNLDSDQDGLPNYRDLDSDDDTIPDGVENSR